MEDSESNTSLILIQVLELIADISSISLFVVIGNFDSSYNDYVANQTTCSCILNVTAVKWHFTHI